MVLIVMKKVIHSLDLELSVMVEIVISCTIILTESFLCAILIVVVWMYLLLFLRWRTVLIRKLLEL